jgi:hypothetical protein
LVFLLEAAQESALQKAVSTVQKLTLNRAPARILRVEDLA